MTSLIIMEKTVWFIILSSSTVILGIRNFTCDADRPLKGSDVVCTCVTQNDIEWQLNDVTLSTCTTSGVCLPQPAGYAFQNDVSTADKEYSLTIQTFDYNSCTVYSCTDSNTLAEEKATLTIAAFNSTVPSDIVEPGAHKNGAVEATTECLFKQSDIVVKWYSVNGDKKEEYKPSTAYAAPTACSDTCNGETAVTLKIGFNHTEERSICKKSVKFRLEVYHTANDTNKLVLETDGKYYIKAPCTELSSTSTTATTSTTTTTANESTPQMSITVVGTSTMSPSPTPANSTVIIVAATVGGLFIVGIVFIVVVFWNHKRKKQLDSTNRSRPGQIRLEPVFSGSHVDHRLKPHSQDYLEQHVKRAEQPRILNPRVEGDRFDRNVSSYPYSTGQQYSNFQHSHGRGYRF